MPRSGVLPGFVCDFRRQVLEGMVDFTFILEEPFPSKTLAVETIKRCVEVGLGIAPLPRMAVEAELLSGTCCRRCTRSRSPRESPA